MNRPDLSRRMKQLWADPERRRQQIRAIRRGWDQEAKEAAERALRHLTKEERQVYNILRARHRWSRAEALRRMRKL